MPDAYSSHSTFAPTSTGEGPPKRQCVSLARTQKVSDPERRSDSGPAAKALGGGRIVKTSGRTAAAWRHHAAAFRPPPALEASRALHVHQSAPPHTPT
eukprot:351140-Chlamydomonas_euryale.AAC.20